MNSAFMTRAIAVTLIVTGAATLAITATWTAAIMAVEIGRRA